MNSFAVIGLNNMVLWIRHSHVYHTDLYSEHEQTLRGDSKYIKFYKIKKYRRSPCGGPRHRWGENTKLYFGKLECNTV